LHLFTIDMLKKSCKGGADSNNSVIASGKSAMHEMGIALQIVEIATASIPPHMKGVRVERINLRIGKLSAVVAQSLTFCLDIITRDSPLEGAGVHIDEIPVVARCRSCAHEWQVEKAVFSCPACGSGELDIVSGRELEVVSLDIADIQKESD